MARFPDGYIMIIKPTETKLENGNVMVNISVDEKELVMCKHCKFCKTEYVNYFGMCMCDGEFRDADDYCSWGERKESEHEDQEADDE